jgi:uncharacterized protein
MPDHPSSDVAFSASVKEQQSQHGSREMYQRMEEHGGFYTEVDDQLAAFIMPLNSFYLGTASAAGQPYIQHRGGPPGFLRILDSKTLGFADFSGNRQYISSGNLAENDKVCLFLMDYVHQRRIKIWGRGRVTTDPAIIAKLMPPNYKARPEQAIIVTIDAWDGNCPQHIPKLVPYANVEKALELVKALEARVVTLEAELKAARKGK